MTMKNTQEKQEILKGKKGKTRLMLESLKATLKLGILVTLISGIALGGKALVDNEQYIRNRIAAKNLAMTYQEVGENDNDTQSEYVKFDAYFLKSSEGTVKKLRGTAIELNERQEIYLELNVLTNGHLENGRITLNASNFKVARDIAADQEIENVYENTQIRFNTIQNGTYKTIPVLIEQTVVDSGSGNKEMLSKINSVTFTGTHVAEDGKRTEISKTVEFKVDWYGSKDVEVMILNKNAYIANQANDKVIIGLQAQIWSGSINDSNIQVPDKAAVLTSTIPLLNGYAPTQVTVKDVSSLAKKLDYTYNQNTRRLEIREEVKYNESGIGRIITYNERYMVNINIVYPYVAYQTLGASTRNLNITVTGQLEGYNNPNSEFVNPVKSKEARKTVSINLKNPEGDIILFETEIDLLTKSKLRLKYDRNINVDDGYRVTWKARVDYTANIEKLIYEEDDENNDVGTERKYITDQMQADDGTHYDLTGIVDYVGIKIPKISMNMLGQNGYVKVINTKTGEVIKTITAQESDKYIAYNVPVEHLRIETSRVENIGSFEIYHYKKINNQAFIDKYTKDQFNSMSLVCGSLNGSADFAGRKEFVNRDIDVAEYEDGTVIIETPSTMQLNTQILNKINQSINFIVDSGYQDDKNLTEWVNPVVILEYPEEIESIQIKNIYSSDDELILKDMIQKVVNGKKVITIKMEGVTRRGSHIKIEQDIKVNSKTTKTTGELRVFAYNELCDMWCYIYQNTQEAPDIYDINKNGNKEELRRVNITEIIYTKPTGLSTNTEALNFDDKGTVIMGPGLAEIEKQSQGREATIRLNVYNNYNTPVTNAKIVGKIPFEGNTYQINGNELGSEFTTIMKNTGIILPDSIKDSVNVYYSTHETVNKNINDSSNGWTKTPSDWSQVKTYLIDLSKIIMNPGDSYTIDYNIIFPEKLTYGTVSYATHAIYFEENTASGKVERSTETNRVGFSVVTTRDYTLQLTKFQKGTTKTVNRVKYKITGPGIREEGINYTTDEQGKITINNLYPEEIYTIEEISAPTNYIKAEDPIEIETYLEDGDIKARIVKGIIKGEPLVENAGASSASVKIEVENEAKYSIQITKYRKLTTQTIPSTTFQMKENKKLQEGEVESWQTIATNEEGIATIGGLIPEKEYILKEKSANRNYLLDTQEIIFRIYRQEDGVLKLELKQGTVKSATLVNGEDSMPQVKIAIENEVKYGLEITKYETGTNSTVKNVKFSIKGKDMPEAGAVYTTDIHGKLEGPMLELGQTYTIQETEAKGYYVDSTKFTIKVVRIGTQFQLEYTGRETKGEVILEQEENQIPKVKIALENVSIPKYQLQLTKVSKRTGKVLKGAKYEIIGAGRDLQEEQRYTTDEEGNLTIDNLYVNEEYTLKEVLAPTGYQLNRQPIKFKATQTGGVWNLEILEGSFAEDVVIEGNTIKTKLENELLFQLEKVDGETGNPLPGTKFTIKDLEGNYAKDTQGNEIGEIEIIHEEEMRVVTTDEKGIISEEIEPGLYQVTEVVPPEGYKLSQMTTQYFGIDDSQEDIRELKVTKSVKLNGSITVERVAPTKDGGFWVVGAIEVGKSQYGVIARYNSNYELVWQEIAEDGKRHYTGVVETDDGGVAIAGFYNGRKY